MTRSMRRLAALAFLFAAGCAGPSVVDEARSRFNDGHGDEALALLQQAAKQNPNDLAVRGEYFRLRELMVAQWLAQAEVLRQAGQYEGAEALYRRVQAHDAANSRAAAGLAQIEADRRHRALVASAEQLVKAGKYREAMFEYLRRLGSAQGLAEVHLVSHQVQREDPQRPIQFAVQATIKDLR